jgi:hypothetical protein
MTELPVPLTPAALETWVREATRERLRLYVQATDLDRSEREDALRGMGEALACAIEVVRTAATTWEASRELSEMPSMAE